MLKRLYIDNYKCLVNFEVNLDKTSLFLGDNGSGKSTVFDVLHKLQAFIGGDGKVDLIFTMSDLCRWQTSLVQSYELDMESIDLGGEFHYRLAIEFSEAGDKNRVSEEQLLFQGRPLFEFKKGEVQLYRDDHSAGPSYPFDWSASGLASIYPRNENKLLTWFKNQMQKMFIVRLIPPLMEEETEERGETRLSEMGGNFVSWYYSISQDQGLVNWLTSVLREVIEGFDSFKFDPYGKRYLLLTRFSYVNLKSLLSYRFKELSDGQRMLIVLYTLLEAAREGNYILCLDEPENFISLPEIQPWINTLWDMCDESQGQAILISHHPEMIDLLASHAFWFERLDGLATRLHPLPQANEEDLRVSELIARRWNNHG